MDILKINNLKLMKKLTYTRMPGLFFKSMKRKGLISGYTIIQNEDVPEVHIGEPLHTISALASSQKGNA